MFTKSFVLDTEKFHEGAAIEITFHAQPPRKYEKLFFGIVIDVNPMEIKFDYYDAKEMIKKSKGSAKRLIRRVVTLDDIKAGKVSLRVLT